MDDELRTARGLVVPARGLDWTFARAGGPGGQHVNTTSSKAMLTVDLAQLEGPAVVVDRVRTALGPELRIVSQVHRSQVRNRDECLARAAEQIDRAARPPDPPRRPSRPTRGSVERRLESKRRTSEKKRTRRTGDW